MILHTKLITKITEYCFVNPKQIQYFFMYNFSKIIEETDCLNGKAFFTLKTFAIVHNINIGMVYISNKNVMH